MEKSIAALRAAFPDASISDVKAALLDNQHHFQPTYDSLAVSFNSRLRARTTRAGAGAMDVDPAVETFRHSDPKFRHHEERWWATALATKKHIAGESPVGEIWDDFASHAAALREVSPRFRNYVNRLGSWSTDKASYSQAVTTLTGLNDYRAFTQVVANFPPEAAADLILILLDNGVASPAAAAWLALFLAPGSPAYAAALPLFLKYSATNAGVWNSRNAMLHAWALHDQDDGSDSDIESPTTRKSASRDRYASTTPAPAALGTSGGVLTGPSRAPSGKKKPSSKKKVKGNR